MSDGDRFIDTNVLLYLFSGDEAKADRAERELAAGGVVSIQVLNEFASIALRKLRFSFLEIREVLATIQAVCRVEPMTATTHALGLQVAERYGISVYDAMIVASALLAECKILLSEDLQDRQVFEGKVEVRNPFR